MTQYLQVKVEDVHVLLPALQVHEVMGLEDVATQNESHVAWRDQVIALLDLGEVLGRPVRCARSHGVVYSSEDGDAEPVMLRVGEVLGLRTPKEAQWHPLPRLPSRALELLDAVWVEPPEGRHSYRVRHPARLLPRAE